MLAFTLSADDAFLFFEICQELKVTTEEQRTQILLEMAKLGKVRNVVQSKSTKDEYKKHLAQHFKVIDVKEK